MTSVVHVDGELVPAAEATVNVRDRGFLYGDALFETLRAYGGELFAWPSHWQRLREGADRIGLDHGLERAEVRERIEDTLDANDLTDAYVRLSITRGRRTGRLAPTGPTDPTVVVMVESLPRGGTAGRAVWDDPAICTIADTQHVADAAVPASLKSHNYLNGILAQQEADTASADEAILLSTNGKLTEGTVTNLFFVTDGVLCTPSLAAHPVLPGVTRRVVLELAVGADIQILTDSWTPTDLFEADEVFLTNTTWEVRPVTAVDDVAFPVGPITSELGRAVDERVERRCYTTED